MKNKSIFGVLIRLSDMLARLETLTKRQLVILRA